MDWRGLSVINRRPVIFHFWSLSMHTIVNWRAKPSAANQTNKKPYQHGFAPRLCWAIPPNRCSPSRGCGGHWDFEKGLLEVLSICCLANLNSKDAPSHQKLQQEAQSNSCLPNSISRSAGAANLAAICWCHQSIVLPKWNCQVQRTCPQGVRWSFGFSGQGTASFWDLQRVLSACGERSQLKSLYTYCCAEILHCLQCNYVYL